MSNHLISTDAVDFTATASLASGRGGAGLRIVVALHRAKRVLRTMLRNARKFLALTTAVAGIALVSSAANAQECVGGYRTIENKVFPCVGADTVSRFGAAEIATPEVTGEIGGAASPKPTAPAMAEKATSPADCQPGGYWYLQTEEAPQTEIPMACQ
jgi:hypothetical protein